MAFSGSSNVQIFMERERETERQRERERERQRERERERKGEGALTNTISLDRKQIEDASFQDNR